MFQFFQNQACVIDEGRHFQHGEHVVSCAVNIIRGNLRPSILPCIWFRFSFELPTEPKMEEIQRTGF